MACVLKMEEVTKVFGPVVANDHVDFELQEGEVHALLGENGAGKSTLMNCLYGMYPMTSGRILLHGEELHLRDADDAMAHGIGMVHQHFMLIPAMTVAENIILGLKQKREPLLDLKTAEKEIKELSDRYNFGIDPKARVRDLSVGMQQRVEILKVLYRNADILILDEPTAVLTPQEATSLFDVVRQLAKEGKSIIMIVHKLEEVMEICDRVTTLRDGKKIGTVLVQDTNPRQLANMMVGRDVVLDLERTPQEAGEVVMEAENIVVTDKNGKHVVDGISLQLRKGEVFGVAGVDGNGQIELSEVLTGMLRAKSGTVKIRGEVVPGKHPKEFVDKKVSHIPQDRHKDGLVLDMSIKENMVLQLHDKKPFSKKGVLDWKVITDNAKQLVEDYRIKINSVEDTPKTLSGGNQQKVILAREINREMDVLVAVQPTRGLDIGATEFVRRKILEQRDKGVPVFLVSTELDEVLSLSDRIAVIHGGKFMDVFENGKYTVEEIGLMMAGVPKEEVRKEENA